MAVAKKGIVGKVAKQDDGLTSSADRFANTVAAGTFSDAPGHELTHEQALSLIIDRLRDVRRSGNRVYLLGNGGSAAVASHIANDLCNSGNLCATTLHEPAILTCYANDYGYEDAFARCLRRSVTRGDLVIAISSSGRSENIINAVRAAATQGATVFTLTGFEAVNPLRRMGHLNFWLDARAYGMVEVGHLFVLHHIADRFAQDGQDPLD